MRAGRRVLFVLVSVAAVIFGLNYFTLQLAMGRVIRSDPRNEGISVWVHYQAYVNPRCVVYDLRGVAGDKAIADVFRVLLQFADETSNRRLDNVLLACRGKHRFTIPGEYFRELGEEYSWQNPAYTSRTMPQHLRRPDGSAAFDTWTGGWLGVIAQQMQDFNEFHMQWYVRELAGVP